MAESLTVVCLGHRFDEECRGQVAEDLKGRGMHLYPNTSPTRYVNSRGVSFLS